MPKASIPRMLGDDFQADFFWFQAARLFAAESPVACVGYETDSPKAFDDVTVRYSSPLSDERGETVNADFFQVKFHVSYRSSITWQALLDPKFIGAASVSLLQRLRDAHEKATATGERARFFFVTPWTIHPEDPLSQLVSGIGGEIRLDALFGAGGPRSRIGRVRQAWKEHLNIDDDAAFRAVIGTLRIWANFDNMESFRARLNDRLIASGLAPVPDTSLVNKYRSLIRKLCTSGRREFNTAELRSILEREGLWIGHAPEPSDVVKVGVRSFSRRAEYLEDEVHHLLSLEKYFDGRDIRSQSLWNAQLLPELDSFLSRSAQGVRRHHLHLEAHCSIAFAAGYLLDPKSGVDVVPVQKFGGRSVWTYNTGVIEPSQPSWSFQSRSVESVSHDVVLAISVTHNILADVETYESQELEGVSRIIHAKIARGVSSTAVRDGGHALQLVQQLVTHLRQNRSPEERSSTLHIFAAAPNGLMFFLGQHARGLGPLVLYEYDFDSGQAGAYQPSIAFLAGGRTDKS